MSLANTLMDKIKELSLQHDFFHEEIGNIEHAQELGEALPGLTCNSVAHHGGEGQGEQYWTVYLFALGEETCHIKFNGWYASYHGSEFTEMFPVNPKEVTVTRYEKV